jgi:hypothetical protein
VCVRVVVKFYTGLCCCMIALAISIAAARGFLNPAAAAAGLSLSVPSTKPRKNLSCGHTPPPDVTCFWFTGSSSRLFSLSIPRCAASIVACETNCGLAAPNVSTPERCNLGQVSRSTLHIAIVGSTMRCPIIYNQQAQTVENPNRYSAISSEKTTDELETYSRGPPYHSTHTLRLHRALCPARQSHRGRRCSFVSRRPLCPACASSCMHFLPSHGPSDT